MKLFLSSLFLFGMLNTSGDTDTKGLRDRLLGTILKGHLERHHFSQKVLNKNLSKKAFSKFLENLDHGKQFLYESDVKKLKTYEQSFADMFDSGEFTLVTESTKILKERIEEVSVIVEKILKENLDFHKKEILETDPKKRKFVSDKKQLQELWRKIIKYSVINNYLTLKEEEKDKDKRNKEAAKKIKQAKKKNAKGKNRKNAKIKLEKKLTEKEILSKAKDDTLKTYRRIFLRLKQQNHDDELERFFNAVANVFDPHTSYLSPQKKENFDIEMKGSLEGIGAHLREDGPYIKVVNVVPGGASWKQKQLEAEDIILKVAQDKEAAVDIVNMRLDDAVKLIRGPKGTTVRLTVKKPTGEVIVIPLVRDVVQIEEAYAKGALVKYKGHKGKIGYITLPRFYRDFDAIAKNKKGRNCTDDVREILEKFNKNKVDGVILDLRDNGGGALEDARLMTGLFINSGPVVQVKNSEGSREVLHDSNKATTYKGPVIVLINRFSASASEILAGALQDYGRAVIVGGDHSHGKGTVQALLNLDQGVMGLAPKLLPTFLPLGALKITIQKFYRINGSSTQYKGIIPDIPLIDPYSYLETGERYLDYSLQWDQVSPVKYSLWKDTKYNLSNLKKNSEKRVKDSLKFQNLEKSVALLKKRRNETTVSLNIKELQAELKQTKEEVEKFKIDKPNNEIDIYKEEKGKFTKTKAPKPLKKNATKEEKKEARRKEAKDWTIGLRKDVYLEEGLFIMNDILKKS